jgi:hypothetical protein
VPWGHSEDGLICLGDLGLELVNLLQVVRKSLVVALLLHTEHRPEVSSIAPLLSILSRNIDSACKAVFVEGADSSADFVGETGRKRVESVLLVKGKNAQASLILRVHIVLHR